MKPQTRMHTTIRTYNGVHWREEESFDMDVQEGCSYVFFKYGAKGNIISKMLTQVAFDWAKANQEMDEIIAKKKERREAQNNNGRR